MLQGGCLCGAVRYRHKGNPKGVTVCHCGMCRRWHSSLGAYAAGTAADYEIEGEGNLRWYASSHDAERGFCAICGSKLFWRATDGASMDATAGSLDRPTHLSTIAHIWVPDKGDYYAIEDGPLRFVEGTDGAPVHGDPRPQQAKDISEHSGRCLCGKISFRLHGKLRNVMSCHCGQCLRAHGHYASYTAATWAQMEPNDWGDDITWYRASDIAQRGFCRHCGSNLFWDPDHKRHVSIGAGLLDLPTGLITDPHIFVADKGDYYAIPKGAAQLPGSSYSPS